jgi:tRNA U34 2-thiouridine synthase MnmA/TrmU
MYAMDQDVRALALLSGGLDSSLAVKLVLEQGIDVIGIKFNSPFCTCDQGGRCYAREIARQFGIPFRTVAKGEEYLSFIRNPKHGYGSGMNPCIDCRIFMFKKAKKMAQEVGAKFFVTGEVLNQRPMSQYLKALKTIEKEAGLEGKILRPLSAKYLLKTEPEIQGWIDREKLMAIKGRSRKTQITLAQEAGIETYACAAGGCLLTHKEFANKLRDLFKYRKRVTWNDILLLKVGRHFRLCRNKIIVGRNKSDNNVLLSRKQKTDYVFEVPGHGGPITILQGVKSTRAIAIAARLTASYSDCIDKQVLVQYGRSRAVHHVIVRPMIPEKRRELNLTYAGRYQTQ